MLQVKDGTISTAVVDQVVLACVDLRRSFMSRPPDRTLKRVKAGGLAGTRTARVSYVRKSGGFGTDRSTEESGDGSQGGRSWLPAKKGF